MNGSDNFSASSDASELFGELRLFYCAISFAVIEVVYLGITLFLTLFIITNTVCYSVIDSRVTACEPMTSFFLNVPAFRERDSSRFWSSSALL